MQAKLMDASDLSKLIGKIGRQRVAFDEAVQMAAVEAIGQSIAHRNITPSMQLLDVVGAHLKAALVAYFERFGNICWGKSEKKLKFHELRVDDVPVEWTDAYRETVEKFIWHTAKKDPAPVSVYDVADEASKFLERMAKVATKGAEIKNKPLLERLTTAYQKYQAETYLQNLTVELTEADRQALGTLSEDAVARLQSHFGRPQVRKAA